MNLTDGRMKHSTDVLILKCDRRFRREEPPPAVMEGISGDANGSDGAFTPYILNTGVLYNIFQK